MHLPTQLSDRLSSTICFVACIFWRLLLPLLLCRFASYTRGRSVGSSLPLSHTSTCVYLLLTFTVSFPLYTSQNANTGRARERLCAIAAQSSQWVFVFLRPLLCCLFVTSFTSSFVFLILTQQNCGSGTDIRISSIVRRCRIHCRSTCADTDTASWAFFCRAS